MRLTNDAPLDGRERAGVVAVVVLPLRRIVEARTSQLAHTRRKDDGAGAPRIPRRAAYPFLLSHAARAYLFPLRMIQ